MKSEVAGRRDVLTHFISLQVGPFSTSKGTTLLALTLPSHEPPLPLPPPNPPLSPSKLEGLTIASLTMITSGYVCPGRNLDVEANDEREDWNSERVRGEVKILGRSSRRMIFFFRGPDCGLV